MKDINKSQFNINLIDLEGDTNPYIYGITNTTGTNFSTYNWKQGPLGNSFHISGMLSNVVLEDKNLDQPYLFNYLTISDPNNNMEFIYPASLMIGTGNNVIYDMTNIPSDFFQKLNSNKNSLLQIKNYSQNESVLLTFLSMDRITLTGAKGYGKRWYADTFFDIKKISQNFTQYNLEPTGVSKTAKDTFLISVEDYYSDNSFDDYTVQDQKIYSIHTGPCEWNIDPIVGRFIRDAGNGYSQKQNVFYLTYKLKLKDIVPSTDSYGQPLLLPQDIQPMILSNAIDEVAITTDVIGYSYLSFSGSIEWYSQGIPSKGIEPVNFILKNQDDFDSYFTLIADRWLKCQKINDSFYELISQGDVTDLISLLPPVETAKKNTNYFIQGNDDSWWHVDDIINQWVETTKPILFNERPLFTSKRVVAQPKSKIQTPQPQTLYWDDLNKDQLNLFYYNGSSIVPYTTNNFDENCQYIIDNRIYRWSMARKRLDFIELGPYSFNIGTRENLVTVKFENSKEWGEWSGKIWNNKKNMYDKEFHMVKETNPSLIGDFKGEDIVNYEFVFSEINVTHYELANNSTLDSFTLDLLNEKYTWWETSWNGVKLPTINGHEFYSTKTAEPENKITGYTKLTTVYVK